MCVTSASASLSETRILSLRLNETQHLLAYSNKAKNLSVLPNSMILPIPGRLSEKDFIDTTPYSGFMEEIERYLTGGGKLGGVSKGITMRGGPSRNVQHFKSGMYEVFVADPAEPTMFAAPAMSHKTSIVDKLIGRKHPVNEALESLQPIDRPQISDSLLEFYDRFYPGWSLVVCVFGPGKAMESQPIMFTYEPLPEWREKTFFPAVDSHTGGPPNLREQVDVDHFLITESVHGDEIPKAPKCPPQLHGRRLAGRKMEEQWANGDWVGSVHENQRSAGLRLKRIVPQ
jgi:hypothetical protein